MFFCNFDLPVICVGVLLRYFFDFVTLNYILLIMVNIVYHDALLGGGVVFDQVGQPSKFSA